MLAALSIKIEGRCVVRWYEEQKRKNINGRKEKYLEDFTALETYFERVVYLIRSTDSKYYTKYKLVIEMKNISKMLFAI